MINDNLASINGLDGRVGDLEEADTVFTGQISVLEDKVGTLETMKTMLAGLIDDNANDILALEGRIETNEGDIDALEGDVEQVELDLEALALRVTDNEGDIDDLEDDVGDLQPAVLALQSAALIEDFFTVNEDVYQYIASSGVVPLIEAFCVDGPGVMIF